MDARELAVWHARGPQLVGAALAPRFDDSVEPIPGQTPEAAMTGHPADS